MWDIWANRLLPKALKRCPKSNKSPDLVTLKGTLHYHDPCPCNGLANFGILNLRKITCQNKPTLNATNWRRILIEIDLIGPKWKLIHIRSSHFPGMGMLNGPKLGGKWKIEILVSVTRWLVQNLTIYSVNRWPDGWLKIWPNTVWPNARRFVQYLT